MMTDKATSRNILGDRNGNPRNATEVKATKDPFKATKMVSLKSLKHLFLN